MCGAFYCKSCLEFGVKVFMDLTLFKGHVVLFLWILCPVWKCILIHLIYIYFFLQQTLSFVVKGSLKAIPGDHFFCDTVWYPNPKTKVGLSDFLLFVHLPMVYYIILSELALYLLSMLLFDLAFYRLQIEFFSFGLSWICLQPFDMFLCCHSLCFKIFVTESSIIVCVFVQIFDTPIYMKLLCTWLRELWSTL